MSKLLLLLSLFSLSLASGYHLNISCGQCSHLPSCSQCINYDGGPFDNYQQCVDPIGCGAYTDNPQIVSFDCLTSDGACSFTVDWGSKSYSGSTSSSDNNWISQQFALNQTIIALYNLTTLPNYNWCSGVGTCDISTGAIVSISIGSVLIAVSVAIAIVCLVQKRRKNQIDSKSLLSEPTTFNRTVISEAQQPKKQLQKIVIEE